MCVKLAFFLALSALLAAPAWAGSDDDKDGIHSSDQCPSRAEIVNRLLDNDGCPDTILIHLMGTIVDAANNQPVTAEVKIAGPASGKTLVAVQSYELKTGSEGIFNIEVGAAGYKTRRGTFLLKRGQALNLSWALVRQ